MTDADTTNPPYAPDDALPPSPGDASRHGLDPVRGRSSGRPVRPVGRVATTQGFDEGVDKGVGRRVNVARSERKTSLLIGGALAAYGLTRGTIRGLLAAGVGAAFVRRGVTGQCQVYEAMGIDTARDDAPDPADYDASAGQIVESATINKPADELYAFWRKLENLPHFMPHLESVTELDDVRSHWVMKGPGGVTLEYDAEIINDEPGRLIAWRSTGHSDVDTAGSVRFVDAPGGRGTQVRVTIDYIPPVGGKFAAKVAHALGLDQEGDVRESLRNFKRLMEAGELPTIQGQSSGRA